MPILVTAFGPFGGRLENASSFALNALRKQFPQIRTRVLPVDSVVAPSRLRQAIREIRPSAVIMLGEAGGSSGLRLETTAWNLLDFRIPDVSGRQPAGCPIKKGAPASLPSTLPLEEIYSCLGALGYPVTRSDDPGRYLCNQVFFNVLSELRKLGLDIPAGFIHLPLEDQFSTANAVRALSEIIKVMDPGISEKSMKTLFHATIYDSPIGAITLVANEHCLCGVYNDGQKHWPKGSDSWIGGDSPVFDSARKWLDGYFSGKTPGTLPKIAFSSGTEFQKKVWNELLAIPAGETVSYGELADKMDSAKAVRAVGAAVGRNPLSIIVPCHRVIGGNGSLTGYAGGLEKKRWLLAHEGVAV